MTYIEIHIVCGLLAVLIERFFNMRRPMKGWDYLVIFVCGPLALVAMLGLELLDALDREW